MGMLAGGILAGGLTWGPLTHHLSAVSHLSLPTLLTLERFAPTVPSVLATAVLTGGIWLFRRWQGPLDLQRQEQPEPEQAAYGLQEGLAQAAKALRGVVEIGVQERILTWILRAVVGGAQWTYQAMEQQFLEGLQRHIVQALATTASITYRIVEHKGLEGLLRQVPQSLQALSRGLQRLTTGKLRRNLVWVAVSLIVAVLALAFYGG